MFWTIFGIGFLFGVAFAVLVIGLIIIKNENKPPMNWNDIPIVRLINRIRKM